MKILNETDEALEKLAKFLDGLKDPIRLKIVRLLFKENRQLSFSEIKTKLRKYGSPELSYHLEALEKLGVITNVRSLDMSTGRARTSFYKLKLSQEGKWVIEALEEIITEYTRRYGKKVNIAI